MSQNSKGCPFDEPNCFNPGVAKVEEKPNDLLKELIALSKGTREAQKEYFKTRSNQWLIIAKEWEMKLDRFLEEVK